MRITQVSSGLTTTQALTSTAARPRLRGRGRGEPNGSVHADARGRRPRRRSLTTNLRRDGLATVRGFFMASSPRHAVRLGALAAASTAAASVDRRADALVGAAAADVGHRLVDVAVGRIRILREQRRRRHDLARLAVAALRHVEREPRLLHGRRARRRQAFDGDDPVGRLDRADRASSTSARRCRSCAPSTRRTARRRSRTWCRSGRPARGSPTAAACRPRPARRAPCR